MTEPQTRKFKLILEYDGSRYHGWQAQSGEITIQKTIEDCLERIVKTRIPIAGSGRTDAGVHAEGQVAHFQCNSRMTEDEFQKALNRLLPPDISISSVEVVPQSFNAQKSAIKKIYRYTILNRAFPSALAYGRVWFIPHRLNVEAMREGKEVLVGKHDFSAFQGAKSDVKTTVRQIFRIDLERKEDFIIFHFEGNGFLKYMVRNIVGTLVEVGKGKMTVDDVKRILDSRDRKQAGPTARPHGLCLVKVFYPGDCDSA